MGGWGCGCEINSFILPGRGTTRGDQMQTRTYVLSMATVSQYVHYSLWKIKNKGESAHFQPQWPHRKDRISISQSINSETYWNKPSELVNLLHYICRWIHAGETICSWILRWFKEKRRATGSLCYFSISAEQNPHFSKPQKMEVEMQNTPTYKR